MNSAPRQIASVSLDLDDKWSYMKTRGDAQWQSFPSYLEIVIPRVLDILNRRSQQITFFIVGQDAALAHNRPLLKSIAAANHEIGNHSFHHEPWLHLYSRTDLEREIAEAESAIGQATGKVTRGFRGPGFSTSPTVLDVLAARGYAYDASTLPTFLGPLARAYYLLTTKLDRAERRKRSQLFGKLRDGFLPLNPHALSTASGSLTEIPVTTIPLLRTPFHLSYLIYLLTYSEVMAHSYLQAALSLCSLRGTAPSFLLHPLDFLGPNEAPELNFFPGMRLPLERKLQLAEFALDCIAKRWQPSTMEAHAAEAQRRLGAARTGSEPVQGTSASHS